MTTRILNGVIAAGMLCHAVACAVALLVTAAWFIHADLPRGSEPLIAVGFLASSTVILWMTHALSEGGVQVRHVVSYLLVSALAFECSRHFYADLMHDLALVAVGHHGRFGCIQDGYLVTSANLPSLTFVSEPVLVSVCLLARSRARRSH